MFIQNSYRFFSDISVFDDPAIGSFTVKTDNTGTSNDNQFTVPLNQNTSDYTITTEDGQVIENLTDSYTITFPTSGTYKIAITGNAFRGFFFANSSDRLKLLSVERFGTDDVFFSGSVNAGNAFARCSNISTIPADASRWLNLCAQAANCFRDIGALSFDDADSITMADCGNFFRFLLNCTVPTDQYSKLLINIEANNTNTSETFNGGSSKYNSSASTARADLVTRGWTIIDGGLE